MPLCIKDIGVFDDKLNKLDKFRLVIFDVVPFIIFDVIVPEFDIDGDVILFVRYDITAYSLIS